MYVNHITYIPPVLLYHLPFILNPLDIMVNNITLLPQPRLILHVTDSSLPRHVYPRPRCQAECRPFRPRIAKQEGEG